MFLEKGAKRGDNKAGDINCKGVYREKNSKFDEPEPRLSFFAVEDLRGSSFVKEVSQIKDDCQGTH